MYLVVCDETDQVVARWNTKYEAERWVEDRTCEGAVYTYHVAHVVATNRSKREWTSE